MNKVVHVNHEPFDIYMGRAYRHRFPCSPWHNPFIAQPGMRSRRIAIQDFAAYFYAPEQKWLRDKALTEISPYAVLGCWCAPQACHAEIVVGYLVWKRHPKYFEYVIDDLVELAAEELAYAAAMEFNEPLKHDWPEADLKCRFQI
jgi:uncharacterized protein DUF4326